MRPGERYLIQDVVNRLWTYADKVTIMTNEFTNPYTKPEGYRIIHHMEITYKDTLYTVVVQPNLTLRLYRGNPNDGEQIGGWIYPDTVITAMDGDL